MSNRTSDREDSESSTNYVGMKAAEYFSGKMQERLGSWGRMIIMLKWVTELVIFAFLFFLWYGEGAAFGGQHASRL